jgi:hypothetical protein
VSLIEFDAGWIDFGTAVQMTRVQATFRSDFRRVQNIAIIWPDFSLIGTTPVDTSHLDT